MRMCTSVLRQPTLYSSWLHGMFKSSTSERRPNEINVVDCDSWWLSGVEFAIGACSSLRGDEQRRSACGDVWKLKLLVTNCNEPKISTRPTCRILSVCRTSDNGSGVDDYDASDIDRELEEG